MVEVPISIMGFILGFVFCLALVICLACSIIKKDEENRRNAMNTYLKMLENIDLKKENEEDNKDE